MARCGIQLGSRLSCISCYDAVNRRAVVVDLNCEDGERRLRSAVYYPGAGKQPVVGKYALHVKKIFPDRVAVGIGRAMGSPTYRFGPVDGREYSPQEVSAKVIEKLIEEAGHFVGEKFMDMAITVPSYFGQIERAATVDAGGMALFRKSRDEIPVDEFEAARRHVNLIEYPQAVALAYCLAFAPEIAANQHLVVYDLGASAFDVALVRVQVLDCPGCDDRKWLAMSTLCVDGNSNLGGHDWDEAMARIVDGKIQEQGHPSPRNDPWDEDILMENSEVGKRTLSFVSPAFVVADRNSHQAEVSQAEFEDATRGHLLKTRDRMLAVMAEGERRFGIARDRMDVLMVGGASRMPMCAAMIREATGKEPLRSTDPECAAAIGAAYWAYLCGGGETPMRISGRDLRLGKAAPRQLTQSDASHSPLAPEITAERIIEFFRKVGLVVCDDRDEIKTCADRIARKPYPFGDQIDGRATAMALAWFKVRSVVESNLDDVLDRVYEERFCGVKELLFQELSKRGLDTATPDVLNALRTLARKVCLIGEPGLECPDGWSLDNQWVNRVLKENRSAYVEGGE